MTFQEALNEVIKNNTIVWRKTHQFADDYDRPPARGVPTPWSEWTRIRMWDCDVPFDAILYFESNNRDDTTNTWSLKWEDDDLTKMDVWAEDWEITTWEQCGEEACPDCKGTGEVDNDDPDGQL
jgi:hypothetical protein